MRSRNLFLFFLLPGSQFCFLLWLRQVSPPPLPPASPCPPPDSFSTLDELHWSHFQQQSLCLCGQEYVYPSCCSKPRDPYVCSSYLADTIATSALPWVSACTDWSLPLRNHSRLVAVHRLSEVPFSAELRQILWLPQHWNNDACESFLAETSAGLERLAREGFVPVAAESPLLGQLPLPLGSNRDNETLKEFLCQSPRLNMAWLFSHRWLLVGLTSRLARFDFFPTSAQAHVISFSSHHFYNRLGDLKRELQSTGRDYWDHVQVFTEGHVQELLALWPPALPSQRGFYYWSWKPYLIDWKLRHMAPGDVLTYLDAGCTVTAGEKPRQLWAEEMAYLARAKLLMYPVHGMAHWTTKEAAAVVGGKRTGTMFAAGVIHMVNCPKVRQFWATEARYARENQDLFTDVYNNRSQGWLWKDNRHDQSLISLLYNKEFEEEMALYGTRPTFSKCKPDCPIYPSRKRY